MAAFSCGRWDGIYLQLCTDTSEKLRTTLLDMPKRIAQYVWVFLRMRRSRPVEEPDGKAFFTPTTSLLLFPSISLWGRSLSKFKESPLIKDAFSETK